MCNETACTAAIAAVQAVSFIEDIFCGKKKLPSVPGR